MAIEKNHQLQSGTILDGRYEIGSALGEGGFGITYSGTNVNTGEHVAIKEFFSRDYMGRASDGTGRTVITADSSEKRFLSERRRFLREARILKDFKDEPGIVSVLDYFEENDTAYIVMQFIEGTTLQKYVEKHGRMDPMDAFERFRPLLQSLKRLHAAGVVHRDISPDNIMVNSAGSLILIDFGSAKDLRSTTQTTATTYKNGYAPPEQYRFNDAPSPAIDIYGLCATMYYCLTGNVPVPSVQRAIYDELIPLNTAAPAVPDQICDMIARGMSVRAEDRQNNVGELIAEIDAVYLTPEERRALRKRRLIRRGILTAAIILLAGIGITHYARNAAHYHMKMKDTSSTHFEWDSEEDAAKMEPVLRRKLDIFAGSNNYELTKSGNEITVTIPLDLFHDSKPDSIVKNYLSYPYSTFDICKTDEKGNVATSHAVDEAIYNRESKDRFRSSDIESINISEDPIPIGPDSTAKIRHFEMVLSENAAESASQLLSDKGALLIIEVDDAMYAYAYSAGDGRTFYLLDSNIVDKEQFKVMKDCTLTGQEGQALTVEDTAGGNLYALLADNFSGDHDAFIRPASRYTELIVDWGRESSGSEPGEFQCDPEKIKDESALIAYEINDDSTPGERSKCIAGFKTRLDALETAYAFGTDHYNDNVIVIKIPVYAVTKSELMMLGGDDYANITNGYSEDPLFYDEIQVDNNVFANINITASDYELEKVSEIVKQNERTGLDHIYLEYGDLPIASVDTKDAKACLEEGRLEFDTLCTSRTDPSGIGEDSEWRRCHLQFAKAVIENALSRDVKLYDVELLDKSGKYEEGGGYYSFEGDCYSGINSIMESLWADLGPSGFEVETRFSDLSTTIVISSYSLDTDGFEEKAAECVAKIMREHTLYNNDAHPKSIIFYLSNEDSRTESDYYYSTTVELIPQVTGDDTDIEEGVAFKILARESIRVEAYGPDDISVVDAGQSISATDRMREAIDKTDLEYEQP